MSEPVKFDVIPGMAYVLVLQDLRSTPNVKFHYIPYVLNGLAAIDRVEHAPGAMSPSMKGYEGRPWYMHPNQEDNLIVCHGKRLVELYTVEHGKMEQFEVGPDYIKHGDKIIHEGPAILGWHPNVFHRVHSPDGSMSLNFARHFEGFDIKTNFNIYELNEETGEYKVLREGHLDQPVTVMGE